MYIRKLICKTITLKIYFYFFYVCIAVEPSIKSTPSWFFCHCHPAVPDCIAINIMRVLEVGSQLVVPDLQPSNDDLGSNDDLNLKLIN